MLTGPAQLSPAPVRVALSRLVALLRAINVGGHTVTMDALRRHFIALGFTDVESFIASGNIIFSARGAPSALERKVETRLAAVLGYEVKTFIRTASEVAAVAGYRPFPKAQMDQAEALNVGFLAAPLGAPAVKALMAMRTAVDDFHVRGREVYWLCRVRQSDSAFSNVRFERGLKVRTTFRGLRTITRLAEKYGWDARDPAP